MSIQQPARFSSFLIKIASRCNLACDYCYMYEHADQSWKDQPKLMSDETRRLVAARIGEYAESAQLTELLVVFHGGEPLLAGYNRIIETAGWIRDSVPPSVRVDASLQTNGVLLSEEAIQALEVADIGISVSVDGPQASHDRHRLDHGGSSTFQKTIEAINRLKQHPKVYCGLIAVVDSRNSPSDLFKFFKSLDPPRLDFLLPDSNYQSLPPGRDKDPDLYVRWLLSAFDLWFDQYADLPVRTFDAILNGVAGIPSETDAFGFGDVSMLSLETDGGYHDLDVLKITSQGGTDIGLNVRTSPIVEAASSPKINFHRRLLQREGLSATCQECDIVDICGGGSVPHRYDGSGFQNPTIYCREMLALVGHVKKRVRQVLSKESNDSAFASQHLDATEQDVALFDDANNGRAFVTSLWQSWAERRIAPFFDAIEQAALMQPELATDVEIIKGSDTTMLVSVVTQPSVFLWTTVMNQTAAGVKSKSIDGLAVDAQPSYIRQINTWIKDGLPETPRLHREDRWLRLPFGNSIVFEASENLAEPLRLTEQALSIVKHWDTATFDEICRLSPEIQFIQDPTAHPDKAVSFSDNTVPGTLYISVRRSGGWIGVYDLADSIVHEHRHQKLYLLQANTPILKVDAPFVHSPWREELRPPSGLFHAVFVFAGLLRYWQFVADSGTSDVRDYAAVEVRSISAKLETAFPVLFTTALTPVGRQLADLLAQQVESSVDCNA